MNRLSTEGRARILLPPLLGGMSVHAVTCLPGASKNTAVKLLTDAGKGELPVTSAPFTLPTGPFPRNAAIPARLTG